MIFSHASLDLDAIALDDLTRTRSFGELVDRSQRVANWLRDGCGLAPGDGIAMLMGNRVEVCELLIGAWLAGVWLTPINRHLTAGEIEYIAADAGAQVLFSDAQHEGLARETSAPRVVCVGDELDAELATASCDPRGADEPAGGTMIYTSGTTGRPKGVRRTRPPTVAAALDGGRAAGRAIGLDGTGPHLITGPMYHAAPLLLAVYDLLAGAPLVIMPRWDEHHFLALVTERRITHTHLVPTMFVRLLQLPERERRAFDPRPLRVVLHGAAPVSQPVKRRMIDWWGPVLVEYWGATEGGVNTLVGSEEWLAHPGTVGRALPRFEVFAVDEARRPLPPGEVGTLYCRHTQLSKVFEYHNAPEKTADAHPEPHLFCIGDVGCVDADGYVYLRDRASNTIISGGVNIYPAEIEQALLEHPAVADVGVFGVPDEEWGESVKAAVELAEGYAASPGLEGEILDWARQHLAGYKVPRSIDFEATLPRHPNGKLYVRQLRDPYWRDTERQI